MIDCKQDIENNLIMQITALKEDEDTVQNQIENLNCEIQKSSDKLKKLVDLYLEGIITKDEIQQKKEEINKIISDRTQKIQALKNPKKNILDTQNKLDIIKNRILQIISKNEYDQSLFQNTIEKIVAYPNNMLHIYIKDIEKPFKIHYKIQGKAENYKVICDFFT